VNRGLSLAEPLEQVNRAILPLASEGRAFDEVCYGLQAVVRPVIVGGRTVIVIVVMIVRVEMMMAVLVVMMGGVLVVPGSHRGRGSLVNAKLGCRNAGPEHAIPRHRTVLDRQAPERGTQAIDRKSQIEQRPEDHVARGARKTVEVRDL
jgi:hypothetical protein